MSDDGKRTCPLGEDCDLTVAWMAGRSDAHAALRRELDAVRAERDRLREWRDELLDAAERCNGDQAHRILPNIWPIIAMAHRARAALRAIAKTPTPGDHDYSDWLSEQGEAQR